MAEITDIGQNDVARKICSFSWEIDNWTWIMENEDLLNDQKFYLDTDKSNIDSYSKWEVGFTKHPTQPEYIQYYWILKEYDAVDKFPVLISFQITQSGRNIGTTYKALEHVTINSINIVKKGVPLDKMWWLQNWLSRFEPITIEIRMQIMPTTGLPTIITTELLDDEASSDLLICTRDEMELNGHQVIFKEKFPTFLKIHSQSVDNKIYLKTVTGRTMKILLRYLYTGELDQTWQDEDIIIEFTRAAGRYQMTELLHMIDNVLGKESEQIAKNCHLLLLPIMQKYSLKNAESMLLHRIVKTVNVARVSDELFTLFGYERPKDLKSTTNPKIQKVLDVWNDLRELPEASFRDVILLGLVEKLHLREMENQLLERIRKTVSNVKSGEQLLNLFGKGEQFEFDVVAILKEVYG